MYERYENDKDVDNDFTNKSTYSKLDFTRTPVEGDN